MRNTAEIYQKLTVGPDKDSTFTVVNICAAAPRLWHVLIWVHVSVAIPEPLSSGHGGLQLLRSHALGRPFIEAHPICSPNPGVKMHSFQL